MLSPLIVRALLSTCVALLGYQLSEAALATSTWTIAFAQNTGAPKPKAKAQPYKAQSRTLYPTDHGPVKSTTNSSARNSYSVPRVSNAGGAPAIKAPKKPSVAASATRQNSTGIITSAQRAPTARKAGGAPSALKARGNAPNAAVQQYEAWKKSRSKR